MTSIDIDAPPERVWALVMDPDRLEEWVTIHRGCGHDDGAPRGLRDGADAAPARGELQGALGARRLRQVPHHAEWHGRGPARSHAETEYRLTPTVDGGTRFDYRNVFTAPLGPLGAGGQPRAGGGLPRREADASLRKLKKLAEARLSNFSNFRTSFDGNAGLWCVINTMADFLDEKKREIEARMKELRPSWTSSTVSRRPRPRSTAWRRSRSAPAPRRAARAARPRRRPPASGPRRRGRPRGSGTRSKQALELVRTRPGITIPEIAEAMGIQQNYLYRVLPALQKDGLVRKEGRGWHPREAA